MKSSYTNSLWLTNLLFYKGMSRMFREQRREGKNNVKIAKPWHQATWKEKTWQKEKAELFFLVLWLIKLNQLLTLLFGFITCTVAFLTSYYSINPAFVHVFKGQSFGRPHRWHSMKFALKYSPIWAPKWPVF